MINASLDDPNQRTSDATIIAVLNILNSEIIGCDANALKTHQRGLNKMIAMRGGLDKLGILGHLARTLTVTMLMGTHDLDSGTILQETSLTSRSMFFFLTYVWRHSRA